MSKSVHIRILTLAIFALALGGAWVCGALVKQEGGGWSSRQREGFLLSLCESNALPAADCAGVVGSRWGSFDVYVGQRRIYVPTSLIGLCWFVFLAIWIATVGAPPGEAKWLWRFTLLIFSGGLAGSLFFVAVMAWGLHEWCPLCVAAHGINGLIIVCTCVLWRGRKHETLAPVSAVGHVDPSRLAMRFRRRQALTACIVAVCAAVGFWLYFDAMSEVRRQWRKLTTVRQTLDRLKGDRGFVLREFDAQPEVSIAPVGEGEGSIRLASDPARPRLVIFTDYDCSACVCFEERRAQVIEVAYGGRLDVEYRHFPRALIALADRSSTDFKTPGASDLSSFAAEAARLQGGQDAFDFMHWLLFKHRKDYPQRDYAELARVAGLDVERFLADLTGEAVRDRVLADIAAGRALGVTTTPALFLNGRRVPELCAASLVFWRAMGERSRRLHETLTAVSEGAFP